MYVCSTKGGRDNASCYFRFRSCAVPIVTHLKSYCSMPIGNLREHRQMPKGASFADINTI